MSKIEEIKARLAEALHQDTLNTNAKFKELGLDSLDMVEMLLKLEEDYGVHFDEVDLSNIVTIQDLLDVIEGLLK